MDKTICELFAGVGGFRLGFERENDEWKTVWFSQWEPGKKKQWAHECYVRHFGDSLDLNGENKTNIDISDVDKNDIPNHSLLVGGFPCLAGDTLVMSDKGTVSIAEITVGDKVLSHDGQLHSVTNIYNQGLKKTYLLSGYAFDKIVATENHRFYVRTRKYKYPTINGKKEKIKYFTTPEWISVKNLLTLKPKDIYFGNKINEDSIIPKWDGVEIYINQTTKKTLKTLDMADKNLWYLAGRYLGNGWLKKQQKKGENRSPYTGIIICCGKHESDGFEKKISKDFYYTKSEEETVIKYHFSSIELAVFMSQFGQGAKNKYLPYSVQCLPLELLEEFVKGYLNSDGCVRENENLQFSTISKRLAYDIASALEKVYHKPCRIHLTKVKKTKVIEDRTVNQNDLYTVHCILNNKHYSAFYEDGFIWYPLKRIIEGQEEHVYDIEVKDTHSFVANRAITHNCQSYSIASTLKNSKGIEGEKGILWWQIRDTLEAKNPPFVLLENVDRLLKSPAKQRGRDFGIMLKCFDDLDYNVEWRVVNAAQYGGAQRRRRVFIFAYKQNTSWNANRDIFKDGFFAKTFPVENEFNIKTIKLHETIGEVSDNFSFDFKRAGYMIDGEIFTSDITEIEEPPITMREIIETDVDEHYYITDEKMPKWVYLKGAKRIPKVAANGYEYIYSEGPVGFPDDLDKPGRTMLTSEGSVNRSSHAIEDPETGRIRIITPIEAERLNGFDDNWTENMTERMRYFVMGNALVVPMITKMVHTLTQIIDAEE